MTAPAPQPELLPDPPMPGELLAYDDAPEPMSTGERLAALAALAPWTWAVVGWSWLVIGHELARVVRGR